MGVVFEYRCTGCGRHLTENFHTFVEERKKLLENNKMEKSQKDEAYTLLLKKYNYEKDCCKLIIITSMKTFKHGTIQ